MLPPLSDYLSVRELSACLKGCIPMLDLCFDLVFLAERADYRLIDTRGHLPLVFNGFCPLKTSGVNLKIVRTFTPSNETETGSAGEQPG